MKLLVTGGCGFIGSAFVRLALSRGAEVVNLDKLTYAGNPENLADVADDEALPLRARPTSPTPTPSRPP